MNVLSFSDKSIPYDTFLNDVAAKVVKFLKNETDDPEYMSQRQSWKTFGRRNVERWRKAGLIDPIKRPGRIEYKTSELRYLQRMSQDYLNQRR